MKKLMPRLRSIAQLDRRALKRVLGISDLFAIGFGDLGSSIYYALGITALFALGATPISLALAGIVFVCTCLTYAELASTFHESGGTASFARHAFNDLISFIAGWGLLFDYIVTIAISAFAVAPYLGFFLPHLKVDAQIQLLFTAFLVLALFVLNFIGIRQSTRTSFVLVTATILTQLIVIVIGFTFVFDLPYILDHIRINVPGQAWSPTWQEFLKGTAMAMVAYTGIESIAQLGAEAKQPARSVPRAVMITMFVLVFMYLGISLVGLSVISPAELGTTYVNDPIAGIAAHLPWGSAVLGSWVGLFGGALLFTAANAGLVGASRLSYNMGEYYQLPRFFFRLHKRFRTPYVALGFFAVLSLIIIVASRGQMVFLADLYNFGAMLAFFFAHLSLIVLRVKKPELHRPFRSPLNIRFGKASIPISALIGCLATMSVWFLIIITKPEGRYIGFAWMIAGVAMYLYYRKKQKIAPLGSLSIEKIRMPEYRQLEIKRILVPTRGGGHTETVQMACELARLHGAELLAVHIIEVPLSMPLDAQLHQRVALADAALKRAEALAREFHVPIEMRVIRCRSTAKTLLELAKAEKFDLIVMSAVHEKPHGRKGIGSLAEKILKEAHCKVWICTD